MADIVGRLFGSLPSGTAESVLAWLSSRGCDLPVHIPLKTIKFARECFTLIDVDSSGTLEPEELLTVFKALGQPASLRQVMRLVESVAGPGAKSLKFGDFAQMMHGAMSSKRRDEIELRSLMQQKTWQGGRGRRGRGGRGGRGARRGGAGSEAMPCKQSAEKEEEEEEEELNWGDFHLLAKAFRRRVVIDGVIADSAGWREKVLALAERRTIVASSAASMWKLRTQRHAQNQAEGRAAGRGGDGVAVGGSGDGAVVAADGRAGQAAVGQGGEEDALGGAFSAGPTPRGACGSDIAVDEQEQASPEPAQRGQRGQRGKQRGWSSQAGPEAEAATGQPAPPEQPQLSPILQQLLDRLRANAAEAGEAAGDAGACSSPGSSSAGSAARGQLGGTAPELPAAASEREADKDVMGGEGSGDGASSAHSQPSAQRGPAVDGGTASGAAGGGYSWQRSAARMHLAAAASRQAAEAPAAAGPEGPAGPLQQPGPTAAAAEAQMARVPLPGAAPPPAAAGAATRQACASAPAQPPVRACRAS